MGTADTTTGPINLGNPNEFSMHELASIVIDMTGSRAKIVHRSLPQDVPRQRKPDILRAQELMSWAPRTELREGLGRTIAYFERLLAKDGIKELLV